MRNFIIILLALFMMSTTAFAGAFKADARTKRIPAGTVFQLDFLQPVSTFSGCEGDSFVATIKNELTSSDSNVIIPAGSVVRGSLSKVNTAKRFSRGAKLYLDFDHVVTPTGRQIPLDMAVCSFENISYDAVGGFLGGVGYWVGDSVADMFRKGQDVYINKGDVINVKLLNPIDIPVY